MCRLPPPPLLSLLNQPLSMLLLLLILLSIFAATSVRRMLRADLVLWSPEPSKEADAASADVDFCTDGAVPGVSSNEPADSPPLRMENFMLVKFGLCRPKALCDLNGRPDICQCIMGINMRQPIGMG